MIKRLAPIILMMIFVRLLFSNFCFAQSSILLMAPEKNLFVVTHQSEVLGKAKTFRIYLPQNGNASARYPVLYVLHGVLCHSEAWPEQTEIDDVANDYQMIQVFPDGDNSWYLDSPIKPEMQYESYIIKELIPFIEHHFPAKTGRENRAIMGASMGGHGAMTLAAKHPDLFCSASSFFGILKLTDERTIKSNLVGPFLTELLGPYKKNKKLWRANSAYELAENFSNREIALFFNWGTTDVTPARQNNLDFHRRLTELGIPHRCNEEYGGHTADFLNATLKEHLDFHWKNLIK